MTAHRGGPQAAMRAANLRRLLACLERGPLSQVELAQAAGLSEATVSNLVRLLLAERRVVLAPGVRNGRRTKVVRLGGHRSAWVLGLDLGRSSIRVGVMSPTDEVWQIEGPIPPSCPYSDALAVAGRLFERLLVERELTRADLVSAVVSVPGLVRSAQHRAAHGLISQGFHQFAGWGSVPLSHDLSEVLDFPVRVENDANLAALAEHRLGAARGSGDFMYVLAEAGIGGALVLDGRVYRGATGVAGEFGHTLVDPDGVACWCGSHGCLETLVNEEALVARLRAANPAPTDLAGVVRGALSGEAAHRAAVHAAGRAIGTVVVGVTTPLDLDLVVVGGRLAGAGNLLLDGVRARLTEFVNVMRPYTIEVARSGLGPDGPLRGALSVARERHVSGALAGPDDLAPARRR
ncbi:ROK family protein [Embleya sp. NPDC059259]|uniref:ROK family protein n=1 Tax=unclassified Embleya TaxID=2699296 RepID=UPI0036780B08